MVCWPYTTYHLAWASIAACPKTRIRTLKIGAKALCLATSAWPRTLCCGNIVDTTVLNSWLLLLHSYQNVNVFATLNLSHSHVSNEIGIVMRPTPIQVLIYIVFIIVCIRLTVLSIFYLSPSVVPVWDVMKTVFFFFSVGIQFSRSKLMWITSHIVYLLLYSLRRMTSSHSARKSLRLKILVM